MKGIILAGGSGTRLYPITLGISKQLMPIYDKPMIYYPLSTLIEAGINEILIITNPEHIAAFKNLLGDGSQLGCKFEYVAQAEPRGLADAFIVGRDFIGDDKVTLILGDNIFYGDSVVETIRDNKDVDGGLIFAAKVHDPERYGVVEFDEDMKVISIEEKPAQPKSSYAIPGLYVFDNEVVKMALNVQPSERGEIEITEIHNEYLRAGKLRVGVLEKGTVWLDTGTFDSMVAAAEYVRVIEQRQGVKIGCIEEAALRLGFIDTEQFAKIAKQLHKSGYL
jgi:glucose-1-phosphate thymidylyltransferase